MNKTTNFIFSALGMAVALCTPASSWALDFHDPASVVERWSEVTGFSKVIDINFNDAGWPDTWAKETGKDCPEWTDGGYVNAVLDVFANGGETVKYPVLFHNCTFATSKSFNGLAGTTAAFARQYYINEKATNYNDWKQPGHTAYLEDNITFNDQKRPTHGEAGFVQMCRNAGQKNADGVMESLHGWVEIDHIPYVERVQWSWSSTSWGRGIKCDYKIGNGPWRPLVWMGSEKQKQGWTVFSDQGYFMENIIDAADVSLRWRVWDGEDPTNPVQVDASGTCPFTQPIDPMAQRQAPRLHKIRIFGNEISAEQADFARNNPVGDVGVLSDLSDFGFGGEQTIPAPDTDAPVVFLTVNQNGTADYTTVQEAIDAVPERTRGIILIAPGIYDENVYAGRKDQPAKFISLVGTDTRTTILTSSVSRGDGTKSYLDCAALNVFSPCFYAENLTIRNTSGNVGQAEALYTGADAHIFRNCCLSGYQDTYKANVGCRGYFTGCTVEGATDFVYDGGLEWFDNCTIRCVKGGGYITAPAESSLPMSRLIYPELSQEYFNPGLFFRNCDVVAAEGVAKGAYFLGRPWKENSGAAFIECRLGEHINAAGWHAWGGSENAASLYEYRNLDTDGNLADVSRRASFSHQASQAEVEAYLNPEFLFGKASKTEFDFKGILNSVSIPSDFVIYDNGFSWNEDENAAGYIVFKNDEYVAFVTRPRFEDDYDASAAYTVRAVSDRGVTSAPAPVKVGTEVKAFLTAEGFGKYTTGGRGGRVVKVTSLADDGSEGTLRWAFSQLKGEPITITFEVSGQIALNSELRINRSDWTLAGQTAPGDGIVITRNKVNFGGSQNFIVRNVRFRIGQKSVDGNILADNACGAENCSNYIFDHCSFGWSVEENMNTADCHFLTVQYSIVHEGLYNAGHSKGARGYGCQWGGSPATYHHNLLAHNQSRSCRFNGARGQDHLVFLEYINNVNFNYGGNGGCYGGENTAPVAEYNGINSAHECNFINNYYKPGPTSNKTRVVFVNSSGARDGATSWAPAKWYVNGNIAEGLQSASADNWTAVTAELYTLDKIRADSRIVPSNPYYQYSISGPVGKYRPEKYMLDNFETAAQAYRTVLAKAGTVNRDKVERRVADEARTGKTAFGGKTIGSGRGILDTENDAEGFFDYPEDYTVPADTDRDGMPDLWESTVGLDPNVADNNRLNRQGYTALEVYLGELMGESLDTYFRDSGVEAVTTLVDMTYDAATQTLYLPDTAIGATLDIYGADGTLRTTRTVTSSAVELRTAGTGVILVHLTGDGIAPRTLKIAL